NFAAAESGLRAALAASASARDRANAWGGLHFFYRVQGMSTPAFDALAHRLEETATFQAPLQIAALRLNNLEAYFETGLEAEVRKILDEYAGQLQAPLNTLAALAEVELAIDGRDVAAAEATLANVESMIE